MVSYCISKTLRILPLGLTWFIASRTSSIAVAAAESGLGDVCYKPDGSVVADGEYYRCDAAINNKICCPVGSSCLVGGFCVREDDDNYSVVFTGGCKTRNFEKDCPNECVASEHLNESGTSLNFLYPCGGDTVCCASSAEENCCSNSFYWPLSNQFQLKSPDSGSEEDGNGSGYHSASRSYTKPWDPSTVVEEVTKTSTTTATDTSTSTNFPAAEQEEDIGMGDAKKLVAIGAGLGVGGALLLVGAVVLVCWHVRRKRRRHAEAAAAAEKSIAGSEGIATSALNSPVDQSHSGNFPILSPASQQRQQIPDFHDAHSHPDLPGGGSPLPPAPPYSPPQYEAGDYQYLVVDGPTPSHASNGPGSGSGGGLPVGPDGKPRLED